MNYTLITSKGKVYTFYIKEVAKTYQQAYGGVLMEAQLVDGLELLVTV
jgi:hypothetical protein